MKQHTEEVTGIKGLPYPLGEDSWVLQLGLEVGESAVTDTGMRITRKSEDVYSLDTVDDASATSD